LLGRLCRDYQANGATAFPGQGKSRGEEVASLKREPSRVKKEQDFLREAAAAFAGFRSKGVGEESHRALDWITLKINWLETSPQMSLTASGSATSPTFALPKGGFICRSW
jgi:hypothetical protein